MKVLGGLVEVIEQIQKTIATHRDPLSASEALTRYALIDPLLRALEWDTADPAQVRPEYRDASGFADYVLMTGEKKSALLEAKRLGVALDQNVTLQALTYCNSIDIEHMIISDGSHWLLYNAFKRGQLQDRITTAFNVERDDAHAVALKALHLWRHNLSAQSITAPPEGVAQPATAQVVVEAAMPSRTLHEPGPVQSSSTLAPSAHPSGGGWRSLSEVAASAGEVSGRPNGLRLPNGVESRIEAWRGVLTGVAEWLDGQGLLAGSAPLHPGGRGNRYLLNTVPTHQDGSPFTERYRTGRGFSLETNYNGPNTIRNTVLLLQRCGVDPATVYLRFGG